MITEEVLNKSVNDFPDFSPNFRVFFFPHLLNSFYEYDCA